MKISLIISVSLCILSIYFLKRYNIQKWIRLVVSILVFCQVILTGAFLVADFFTGMGIDDSVIYHLAYGMNGAGFGEYLGIIFVALIFLIMAPASAYFALASNKSHKACSNAFTILPLFFIFLSLVIHPAAANISSIYMKSASNMHSASNVNSASNLSDEISVEFPDGFINPHPEPSGPPLNLVFVYLESFEYTYFNESIFPGLINGLRSLSESATLFRGIKQYLGAGWTIAGMVSSQCGIPLVTSSHGNSMGGMDKFLSSAICMGDLLKAAGYDLHYLTGDSLDFAGKGKFFNTHGFANLQGREELSSNVERGYMSAWGLYDDSLFDIAYDKFEKISKSDKPFGLIISTSDTHHPRGHLSRSCVDKYDDGINPILNAVHCSDKLITKFVNKLRNSDVSNNTLIVLASDHLAMNNTASELLKTGDRENLFMIIQPDVANGNAISKTASQLDIAPTIMSRMNLNISGLGFGRDLMGALPTLAEQYDDPNLFLLGHQKFFSSLWAYPQLKDQIWIDFKHKELRIDGSAVKYPVLIVMNERLEVKDIIFDFYSDSASPRLIDKVRKSAPNDMLIWVDQCRAISGLNGDMSLFQSRMDCIAVGGIGAKWNIDFLGNSESINRNSLERIGGSMTFDAELARIQSNRLKLITIFGDYSSEYTDLSSSDKNTEIFVTSSGHDFGASNIKVLASNDYKTIMNAERGLTLVGIKNEAVPEELLHVDLCKPKNATTDNEDNEGRFVDYITKKDYQYFVILAHDSAFSQRLCNVDANLEKYFGGLPLDSWKDLGFRDPYIGIVMNGKKLYDYVGHGQIRLKL